jgi:hypothetical protein
MHGEQKVKLYDQYYLLGTFLSRIYENVVRSVLYVFTTSVETGI